MLNILIVDDHPMLLEGMAMFLKQAFPAQVNEVFKANNCEEAIEVASKYPLNFVLLDIGFSHNGREGMTALVNLRAKFNSLSIVIYSEHIEDKALVSEALRKGAISFIPKNLPKQELAKVFSKLLFGELHFPSSFSYKPSSNKVTTADELGITPRQFDVLRWLVYGCCNKTIARRLDIAEQTVRNHLNPLFKHFGVQTRAELIVQAFTRGIIFGPPEISNNDN